MTPSWITLAVNIVSLVLLGLLWPIWCYLRQLRENDLHAIAGRLDRLDATIAESRLALAHRVEVLEAKVDAHVQYHMGQLR